MVKTIMDKGQSQDQAISGGSLPDLEGEQLLEI